jgi:hypothetical protein
VRTISAWFDAALTRRFLWASALTWYALHTVMWVAEALKTHAGAATVLNQSDSVYYSAIVEGGYTGRNFAFFPLFPMIVRGIWLALGRLVAPQIIGAAVSTACVAAFVALTVRWLEVRELRGLVPGSRFAWLTFLLWPASYVLRTHHTEGLFLLLSFVAFVRGRQGRWVEGAVFAGLAALCRNQGVLVAALVAVDVAYRAGSWKRFVAAGAISFAVFLPMPVGDFVASGDALAFYHAQRDWTQAHAPIEFARALWLGNPWQRKALGGIVHNVIWLACLPFTWKMRSSSRIQALYAFLSLEIIILQGELVMTFRFVAVVFSFLYFLGDWFGQQRNAVRVPFALVMLLLALQTTWKYPIGGHAY